MFQTIYTFQLAVHRHQSAPLRRERERFLEKRRDDGANRHLLQHDATLLIHIVDQLKIEKLRPVSNLEIKGAARKWLRKIVKERKTVPSETAFYSFTGLAKRFLQFHNSFVEPKKVPTGFEPIVKRYVEFLEIDRGKHSSTVISYRWHTVHFVNWISLRHKELRSLTLSDIDNYLREQSKRWNTWTLVTATNAVRSFLRFTRDQRLTHVIPEGVRGPRARKRVVHAVGPSWIDVKRLLRSESLDTPASMRVQVLLFLFALYGLRTSEATGLTLNSFDWATNTFTVRRAKNYKLQRFPIFSRFRAGLKRYLTLGRPQCSSNFLLATLRPPYRALKPGSVSAIISSRMEKLNIPSYRKGARSLRHSCATRLLSKKMSLQQIADYLGHSDCASVSIYAKHDLSSLKRVVQPDLCDGL
ncbi:MAG TPA: tyrosine-type recombinase/integrase [Candidatus Acidoferrum sp.]|nr:tyrosine-type recombinase/integrase [Candidatus Acidoferrum sp.]